MADETLPWNSVTGSAGPVIQNLYGLMKKKRRRGPEARQNKVSVRKKSITVKTHSRGK